MSDVSKVEEVFLEAVDQPDPAQRATYLDAACGGDEDFRRGATRSRGHPSIDG